MSNGDKQLTERDKLEALKDLHEKALRQWNERRKYEWVVFAYFVIFVGAAAKLILDAPLNLDFWTKVVLTVLFILAASAIVWFLGGIHSRNTHHGGYICTLHSRIVDLIKESHQEPPKSTPWSFGPQVMFLATVTLALLLLLWRRDARHVPSLPQREAATHAGQ